LKALWSCIGLVALIGVPAAERAKIGVALAALVASLQKQDGDGDDPEI
jgi:hypothetical protein